MCEILPWNIGRKHESSPIFRPFWNSRHIFFWPCTIDTHKSPKDFVFSLQRSNMLSGRWFVSYHHHPMITRDNLRKKRVSFARRCVDETIVNTTLRAWYDKQRRLSGFTCSPMLCILIWWCSLYIFWDAKRSRKKAPKYRIARYQTPHRFLRLFWESS